jgi:hypothetical protein
MSYDRSFSVSKVARRKMKRYEQLFIILLVMSDKK